MWRMLSSWSEVDKAAAERGEGLLPVGSCVPLSPEEEMAWKAGKAYGVPMGIGPRPQRRCKKCGTDFDFLPGLIERP